MIASDTRTIQLKSRMHSSTLALMKAELKISVEDQALIREKRAAIQELQQELASIFERYLGPGLKVATFAGKVGAPVLMRSAEAVESHADRWPFPDHCFEYVDPPGVCVEVPCGQQIPW
jgi:hypothetical protein